MHKFRLIVSFLLNGILLSKGIIVQPSGPTHRNNAIKCLEQISVNAYGVIRNKSNYHSQFLLTYVITKNITSPGYEIQDNILKYLHTRAVWNIEVLQHTRLEFEAYSENCPVRSDFHTTDATNETPNCKRTHVVNFKTRLYVTVTDDLEMFFRKLIHLKDTSSFNSDALFVVYYSRIAQDNMDVARNITTALAELSIRNVVVMISRETTRFDLFSSTVRGSYFSRCYSELTTTLTTQCNQGKLPTPVELFKETEPLNDFSQCRIDVHALPYEPFVISSRSGIEIKIIEEMGKALNISFRIKLYPNTIIQLGERMPNGSWAGFLKPVYDAWGLGIGNIAPEPELVEHFTYSVYYHAVKLVCVVPIAGLVPSWRVPMVIFTMEMWSICLAVIFGFAVAFYVFKMKGEAKTFKTLQQCIMSAYQVLIAHPVSRQPTTNFCRVFFASLAIFAIIINSVYTSSLIYFLQIPIREHQVSAVEEIVENYPIGGSPKYQEMFNASTSEVAKTILRSYQTVNESLDTYNYWLEKVAMERNISTIAVKSHVSYLLSTYSSVVTDSHKHGKVFIAPSALRTQPIGIIMRKGSFVQESLNKIIQRLIIEAGLFVKFKKYYINSVAEHAEDIERTKSKNVDNDDDDDDDHDGFDETVTPLSTYHLEGAFGILALGLACALFVFIIELLHYIALHCEIV